jgi:L-ascorbate metabolism protein UlaG (beta-lactamase superfamily)
MSARGTISSIALGAVVAAATLAGCSSSAATNGTPTASTSAATPASSTAAPGIKIAYEESAQIEIIRTSGHRIFIDVASPENMSTPATADDILLTTHGHNDHYVEDWANTFPGKKLNIEAGTLAADGVSVTSITSIHDEGMPYLDKGGTDYLMVIDVDGFRIAHFGDIGQDKLSEEQLAKIGKVDVLCTQLASSFSSMDDKNKKGFNLANQVKPSIVIPTHFNMEAATVAAATWKATYSSEPISLTRASLPSETTIVFMGILAESYGSIFKLKPSDW